MSENVPNFETATSLKETRRNTEKADVRAKKAANAAKVAKAKSLNFKDYYQPQEYVANPRYTATWQMKEEAKRNHRIEKGLLENPGCHNKEKLPDPTTKWVDNPKIHAKSLLTENRRLDHLKDQ